MQRENSIIDRGGLQVLAPGTALTLLGSVPVGRVAFAEGPRVVILPVAHVTDGEAVVFASARGAKLGAAAARRPVAYEADDYDAAARSGWSVLVRGTADLVTDAAERQRLLATGLAPWVEAFGQAELVRVQAERITGRRILRGPLRLPDAPPAGSGPTGLRRLEPLDPATCRELLGSVPVGRLGMLVHDRPVLFPVNHAVDGGDVVVRTAPGSKLDTALQRAGGPASFEVDAYDAATRTGWSVLVTGHLHPVLEVREARGLDRLGLDVWADAAPRSRWLRLVPDELTGRRLTAGGER